MTPEMHNDLVRKVVELENEIATIRNEVSVVTSLQRTCADLDTRLTKIEASDNDLLQQCSQSLVDVQRRLRVLEGQTRTVQGRTMASFASVNELVNQIGGMFDCRNGDHRVCHTYWDKKESQYRQAPYTVLALIAPATIPDVVSKLREAMYVSFHKLKLTCKSERPVLYWRYAHEERIQEEYDGGLAGVGPARHKIRTRIAIPEADFSVVSEMTPQEGGPVTEMKG